MVESYDFLGKEKPLPDIRKTPELVSESIALQSRLKKEYSELNNLEEILSKRKTPEKPIEILLTGDENDRIYLLSKIEQFKGQIEKLSAKKSKLKKDYNLELNNNTLEVTVSIGISITNQEYYQGKLKEIKEQIDKYSAKINSLIIYIDLREAKKLKFSFAKDLIKLKKILSFAYTNVTVEFLYSHRSQIAHKIKKAEQKAISREISKKEEQEELEVTLKKHTIEGPDLRPWPMIYFGLVAVEEYDENSKGHKHKGYLRYKDLITK